MYQKPVQMLTDQQIARLFAQLEIPVAVQMVLDGQRKLDDDTILALHDLISQQTPDRALIALALSALLLDARLRDDGIRCAEILAMSAEMMVQDYAPLYIEQVATHPGGTLFDRNDLEFLSTIPEDLENLGDLLAVVADVVPEDKKMYRQIASIMSAQAQAQALVAETLVEAFGEEWLTDSDDDAQLTATPAIPLGDNVIPFRRK